GTEVWAIQLTQNKISLEKGVSYKLSFDISCSIERSIEVSLSKNGGDYASYSGRDTLKLSPQIMHFEKIFTMKENTDRDSRIEFNCGKGRGKIVIKKVSLVKFDEPLIVSIRSPKKGDLIYEGRPFTIEWTSFNIKDSLRIELSTDNGLSGRTIAIVEKESGSFRWIPDRHYSPWCLIRISNVKDTTVSITNGTFEIAPSRELVKNGNFSDGTENWYLGIYGGSADGKISNTDKDSVYQVQIKSSATENWQIQLTQNKIPLIKGECYLFSFIAYSQVPTKIMVNIGMDHDPYISYLDTTNVIISISDTPQVYVFTFTMKEKTDSSSRVEFNCGKAQGSIFIDKVSVTPTYKVGDITSILIKKKKEEYSPFSVVILRRDNYQYYNLFCIDRGLEYFDLKGRIIYKSYITKKEGSSKYSKGFYIIKTR
ncbi:MAG: carbohydrate binding domain-containing protein, partial [Chitinispirillaceae bacterium]|nr:carbohydrate binding domain-containing protein [Chitinispirillaceae bacterium]